MVPVVEAQDVERSRAEVVTFAETLANTTKFTLVCPVEHASAQAWVEMFRIASGVQDLSVEPTVGLLATVLPDLHLDDDCAATTMLAAREWISMATMAGPVVGLSCPNTIASGAVMKLAGELFQVALAQVVRPGTPVLVDLGAFVLDMSTAELGLSGPEYPLGVAAMAQAARRVGIPSYCCALSTDAKVGGFQAGLEKMAGMMAAALAGVDLTTNMGMVSACAVASLEQLVMDHELCAFVDRFLKGVSVNADTLAMDVIREVELGGEFVSHPHTVTHCRSGEIWYPRLLDRTAVGVEAVSIYDRAHEQVEEILGTHEPEVDTRVLKDLESYVGSLA